MALKTRCQALVFFLLLLSTACAQETFAVLPLKTGFYVSSETPCADASNATLLRVHKSGVSAAHAYCEYAKIEKISGNSFHVTERCTEIPGDGSTRTNSTTYTLVDDTHFALENEDGWKVSARYCPQHDLPEPWRGLDLDENG